MDDWRGEHRVCRVRSVEALSNLGKYESANPLKKALLKRFLEKTRDVMGSDPGRVLDVGTGEGLFWADGHEFDVIGVDLRQEALVAARSRRIHVANASAFALPFANDSFDFVVAIEILEHLDDPAAAIGELARVARGRGLITVPWEPWFSLMVLIGTGQHVRRMGREPEHVQAFGPNDLRDLLGDHFAMVDVRTTLPWIVAEVSVSA